VKRAAIQYDGEEIEGKEMFEREAHGGGFTLEGIEGLV